MRVSNLLTMACLVLPASAATHAPAIDPQTLVTAGLDAMGGDALRNAHSLRIGGIEHVFVLGNAERAEGPWRVIYSRFAELRDLDAIRLRRTVTPLSGGGGAGAQVIVLTDSVMAVTTNGAQSGGSPISVDDVLDRLSGAPDRALLLAAASTRLRYDGTVSRWGVTHDVVSFPWRTGRMAIELSRETHLPTAVQIVRTYDEDYRRAPFGDVTVRIEYVDWNVDPAGIWWPRQLILSQNGEPLRNITVDSLHFGNQPVPADSFTVSDSARAQFADNAKRTTRTLGFGANGPPTEIADGIVRIPDNWAMTLVRQDDGVVIFEAHISAAYVDAVIAEAHRRFPGLPIKAVVMTSDPWAHIGGVREVMAKNIPIYINARSVPFLTRLAHMPYTLEPDALARAPHPPRIIPVAGKVVIGHGPNTIVLYPVGGPYAERMTMAYFPERRLLYGADLVFPMPDGKGFDPTPATDLRRAVAREHLAVDSVFCVQRAPLVAWPAFVPAV